MKTSQLLSLLLGVGAALTARAQLGTYNYAPASLAQVEIPAGQSVDYLQQVPAFATSPSLVMTVSRFFNDLGVHVPDNSAVGVANEQTVTGLTGPIGSVAVSLNLVARGDGPMFNGDMFVTLTHESGYAVLLNRVGRRSDSLLGYGDNGFAVTFSDVAAADVHSYRLTLNGGHDIPLSAGDPPAGLTGAWQPDGRAVDPAQVLDTSPRTATLSSFNGLDPNGTWTLFLADLSGGGEVMLESWALEFVPVPEPAEVAAITAAGLGLFAWLLRRCRR